jgi:hypothetical protein
MIPEKHRQTAEREGIAWAIHLFADFTEGGRGSAFTWEGLEEMVVRLAEVNVFTAFPERVWKRHKTKIKEISIREAKETCKHLYKILYHNPVTNTHV